MVEADNDWFERYESEEGQVRRVSKFARKDFTVPVETVEAEWPSWTPAYRARFAAAFGFSRRVELNDNDRRLLDFLVNNGEPGIWRMLAFPVVWNLDRDRALKFLLARVTEGAGPLANYYQALGKLLASECVPILIEALSRHHREVKEHPTLQCWDDRFIYLDYLSCSATLFKITGDEKYRANLKRMMRHADAVIKNMVGAVAATSDIILDEG
ncbi:MAG TPA: hypothetical protein VK302_04090 [Terriglobales bacterium]|nr:hypothetical protein [Terriglobales bacterium]